MYNHSKPLIDESQKPGLAGKLLKLVGVLLTLLIVILVGLAIFIRFYLTEERIKELIIPPAENALGRTVTLDAANVGLFSGIIVEGLAIKEADNQSNFLSVGRFVLRYNLLPLLQKKLVISEITFDQPVCRLSRDKKGRFNFDSLALLSDKPAKPKKPATGAATSLPLALTVDRIVINKALITLHDAKEELPEIHTTASADIGISIGTSLSDLTAGGDFDFASNLVYSDIKAQVGGKGTFDNRAATCTITVDVDQQKIKLVANAKDLTAKPLPPLTLDISSDKLNINKLLALTEKLPQPEKEQKATKTKTTKKSINTGLPPGLDLVGSVRVTEVQYDKLALQNLVLLYALREGVATVNDLSFKVAGGNLAGKAQVDLTTTDPTYKGTLNITALQIQELLAAIASPQANIIAGGMAADLKFFGTGFTVDRLKKYLNLDATYSMQGARLSETPISKTLATVLQLEELRSLALDKVDGNLQLKKGKLYLRSLLNGADIKAETDGNVDINSGKLDLPVKLEFSGAMAEKLRQKASFMKYLSDKEGTTAVNLKLSGTTAAPKAVLDTAAAGKQIQKKLEQKAIDEIGKKLLGTPPAEEDGKSAEPVKQIFKGLFGN